MDSDMTEQRASLTGRDVSYIWGRRYLRLGRKALNVATGMHSDVSTSQIVHTKLDTG